MKNNTRKEKKKKGMENGDTQIEKERLTDRYSRRKEKGKKGKWKKKERLTD
jgi:hypothetical protein